MSVVAAAGLDLSVPSQVAVIASDEEAVAAAAGPLDGPGLVHLLARAKAEAVTGALVDGAP
ncbi:MAG: septum formation inhibitor Maf, partial [Solirubrobacteraceae bacterium]